MDKQWVKDRFAEYVQAYDLEDPKVQLKVVHTYKVAELCETIGASLELEDEQLKLVWLAGMLHDIGRFEQLRKYNTFTDGISVDHANLGCDLLFGSTFTTEEYAANGKQLLRFFCPDTQWDEILFQMIYQHNKYQLSEELEENTRLLCHILRDADKIDIFRANRKTPYEDIYGCTTEELYQSEITPEVLACIVERKAVLKSYKRTPVDHIVGMISLAFELEFPISYQLAKQQGYLQEIIEFPSRNPKTRKQFEEIQRAMKQWGQTR